MKIFKEYVAAWSRGNHRNCSTAVSVSHVYICILMPCHYLCHPRYTYKDTQSSPCCAKIQKHTTRASFQRLYTRKIKIFKTFKNHIFYISNPTFTKLCYIPACIFNELVNLRFYGGSQRNWPPLKNIISECLTCLNISGVCIYSRVKYCLPPPPLEGDTSSPFSHICDKLFIS